MSFTTNDTAPSLTGANIGSTVRGVVMTLGGYFVGHGTLTGDQLQTIAGIAAAVAPLIWAYFRNKNQNDALKAAIAAPAGKAN